MICDLRFAIERPRRRRPCGCPKTNPGADDRIIENQKSKIKNLYDVVVRGETVAGVAVAIQLARQGRRVAVVAADCPQVECPLAEWAPADLFDLEPLTGVVKASGPKAFSNVIYHSADGERSAEYAARKVLGYFFGADRLLKALTAAGRRAGVKFIAKGAGTVKLAEHDVTVAGARRVTGRILLAACDAPTGAIGMLRLPVRRVSPGRLEAVGLDVTWTAAGLKKHFGEAMHVVHLGRGDEIALYFAVGSTGHLRLVRPRGIASKPAESLSKLVKTLKAGGLWPDSLPLDRMNAAVWNPPAGAALELDGHVAKRTLLVGTAGGFADLMTAQTIAPSIRSALLAGEVAAEALDSDEPQDALNGFSTRWREALVDSLRPPHTSVGMLLGLGFVNKQMVRRFTRAMLYGESL